MKSNSALRVVENNSFASKDFTIQASGKMFHMVISGLYSNKPQSITREIWSNAFDAHAMVGKEDVPFEVTFPTSLSPTFSCRDFGPGIAHEDMEGFYTVLGHSTKEDTNKAVGKWGVGRMSPMSYTDTFSVVSRHKGMIAYYSVQLGSDGSPQLHVLAPPMPTTDADGLEVSFPVKRMDVNEFQRAAEIVSYGFTLPPVVTNSQEKTFAPIKKIFEGDGYYLYEDSRISGAYAQMGCVLYPIPQQHLSFNRSIVYKFEIGDLEVTASREALSFGPNDPTLENIKAHAGIVEDQIVAKMQAELDAQPKLFLAAKLAPKLRRYVRTSNFKYRGADLPRYWDLAKYTSFSLYCGYKSYRGKSVGWGLDKQIDVSDDNTIFIQDTSDKKGCVRAATRISAALPSYTRYIWVRANLSDPAVKADVGAMIDELDYPVKYLVDLPDEGAATRGSRSKIVVSLLAGGSLDRYDMDDVAFKAGGYCYFMSNNEVPAHVRQAVKLAKVKLGKDVVMVPKTLWSKFDKQTNWVKFEDQIEAMVKAEADTVRNQFGNRYNVYPMHKMRDLVAAGGEVAAFGNKAVVVKPSEYLGLGYNSWRELLKHYNLETFSDDQPLAEYRSLLDKYPLLRLHESSNGKMDEQFIQYIQLIDNAAKE